MEKKGVKMGCRSGFEQEGEGGEEVRGRGQEGCCGGKRRRGHGACDGGSSRGGGVRYVGQPVGVSFFRPWLMSKLRNRQVIYGNRILGLAPHHTDHDFFLPWICGSRGGWDCYIGSLFFVKSTGEKD